MIGAISVEPDLSVTTGVTCPTGRDQRGLAEGTVPARRRHR
ncbi:hypothetical protein [Nocardioides yefusunii]|nr:hypothetical protein [Nocardioides yefusunii]